MSRVCPFLRCVLHCPVWSFPLNITYFQVCLVPWWLLFLSVLSVPVLWNMLSARARRSENDKKSFPMWSFSISVLVGRNWPTGKNILPQALLCLSWSLILLSCFLWSCLSEIFIWTLGAVTWLVLEKLDAENGRLGNVWETVVWKSNFFLAERTCHPPALVSIPLESSDSLGICFGIYSSEETRNSEDGCSPYHIFFLWVNEDCKRRPVQMWHEVLLSLPSIFFFSEQVAQEGKKSCLGMTALPKTLGMRSQSHHFIFPSRFKDSREFFSCLPKKLQIWKHS